MFRTEHRQVRDLLLDLVRAFQELDAGRARSLLTAVGDATGPHFRYEEEAMYPQLTGIFGDAYVAKLTTSAVSPSSARSSPRVKPTTSPNSGSAGHTSDCGSGSSSSAWTGARPGGRR